MKKILMIALMLAATGNAFAQTDSTQSTETQSTDTPSTETETTDTESSAAPTLSAAQLFQRAQEQAVQAEVAYPVSFYDRTLWKAAVNDAVSAATSEPGNRDYQSYAAQLLTKTQWWIAAYNAWLRLGELTDQEKAIASLAAAKLAYLALQNGNRDAARQYVTQGQAWQNNQSLQDISTRLGQ
ncbi:hypothetical protein [Deinococcus yavapaiensis]|nr:hypothetical protein [Deinococcus yavapaiensis]